MSEEVVRTWENTPALVEFCDVHVVFTQRLKRPVHALRGLNLTVRQGAVMGLLGPNGSGKTTAFSCLQGLLSPQAGRIKVGPSAGENSPLPQFGVLLEDTRLPPFLPVRDALTLTCKLRGLAGDGALRETERLVELLRMQDLLDRRVAVLSKGQARRVGLAAALIGDPSLLILDEPSAGMDVETRVEFEGLLRGLNDGERTVLVASHLLSDIQNTCSHVAIMREGRIVTTGEVAKLLRQKNEGDPSSDIHVPSSAVKSLRELGIDHDESRYPGSVKLKTALPDVDVLGMLLSKNITPSRLEPRTNLVSVYLSWTNDEDGA